VKKTTPKETNDLLNEILDTLNDRVLADDLFQFFWLVDPIQLERRLYTLDIPDPVKAQLLQLSVFQILPYEISPVDSVVDKSFQVFLEAVGRNKKWANLIRQHESQAT
jgi:hypothetical protein